MKRMIAGIKQVKGEFEIRERLPITRNFLLQLNICQTRTGGFLVLRLHHFKVSE